MTLNFDADAGVKKKTARHQCENHFRLQRTQGLGTGGVETISSCAKFDDTSNKGGVKAKFSVDLNSGWGGGVNKFCLNATCLHSFPKKKQTRRNIVEDGHDKIINVLCLWKSDSFCVFARSTVDLNEQLIH